MSDSVRPYAQRPTSLLCPQDSLGKNTGVGCHLVAQLYLTLCIPLDCSMSGFPVHHHLPELAQTHVHRLGDAIQPSHPLLYPLLLPSIFPSIRIFLNESFLCIRWPKYWSFSFIISLSNEYLGLVYFRIDILGIIYIRNHF